MLDIKSNRLNYGELLMPPEGFRLVRAIGTTYSLDLYTLLSIPVALFYARSLEGDFKQNRYDILDAIRQSRDKVTIFCQRGKIKAPAKYNTLLAFLESAVVEVTPPTEFHSFHPKVWVMRFERKKEKVYRVIVLSRNLTFDRSWDLAYMAEGSLQKKQNPEAKKIASYLSYFIDNSSVNTDKTFLLDLKKVVFDIPENFSDFSFHPISGFSKIYQKEFKNPLPNLSFKELMIVSPFVDETTLNLLSAKNKKLSLFSREEELDKIDPAILGRIETFYLNPKISEGESTIDSEGLEILSQNLHAKLFIGENGAERSWFLGSANCTAPALNRNTEFLVELKSSSYKVGIKALKDTFCDPKKPLFLPYHPPLHKSLNNFENIDSLLRTVIFKIAQIKFMGKALKRDRQCTYDLRIDADLSETFLNSDFSIEARLIHRSSSPQALCFGTTNELYFENIGLVNLSCFLLLDILYLAEERTSVLIKVNINLPEEREDLIFHELINCREKFYQYLRFLLAPQEFDALLEIPTDETLSEIQKQKQGQIASNFFEAPIYEQLMISASRSPEKLTEIENVVKRLEKLSSEVVEDFLPVWEVFKEFAK